MKQTFLLRAVAFMVTLACALGATAQEAYACYTPENTTLTFYYDNQRSSRSGTTYSLPEDTDNPYSIIQQPGWISDSTNAHVTKVVFATAFTHARPTTTQYWFLNMHQLQSINGIENLNTSSVTKMLYMFCGCSNLTNLDLSHFDTSNVTTMNEMFASCSSLTSLDLSNFNTSNVTTMYSMFSNCTGLTSLDLSNFNTSNVTTMNDMFDNCSGLTSLDLSNFNTSNVTTMKWMFYHCSDLTSLDLTSFNTYSVTSMSNMFASCSSLNSIFVSPNGWSTDAVIQSENMFFACTRLEGGKGTTYDADHVDKTYAHIDGGVDNPGYLSNINDPRPYACYTSSNKTLTFYYDNLRSSRSGTTYDMIRAGSIYGTPGWNVYEVYHYVTRVVFDSSFAGARPTTTAYWFSLMSGLQTITGIEYLNTSSVTNMSYMFDGCSSLTSLSVSNFNTSNVNYMSYMFDDCSSLTSLDVSGFNTSNVYDMSHMFDDCTGLTSLNVSNFNTSNVTNMSFMFDYCSGLTSLNVSGFNTSKVTDISAMFANCAGLTSLNVSNFNTSKVTDMSSMFSGCSGLTSLNVSNFNTSNVTDIGWMFNECSGLTSLDVSNFNTSNVITMQRMFEACTGLTSLDLSNFNTANVEVMEYMFAGSSNLTTIYAGQGWSTASVTNSDNMFNNCTSLVGGKGTTYSPSNPKDKTYARIDRGPGTPGYFRQGYSFFVNGIYYNITGSNTVEVASDGENSYSGIVTIPSSVGYNGVTYQVTGIGNDAFYNCTDLDSVSIPPTVTAIRHDAFYNCSVLEHVTLPSGLTTIGDNAFHLCWNLRDITIPDHVEYIGVGAFMECSNLASVVIGNSVTTIGQQAFDHCTSLTSVVIPNSVTTIGKKAFYGCSNLENAVIGSGATSIGSQAFYSCTNLRIITCRSTTPPTMAASDVFDNSAYTYATLFVPNGSLSAYQSANWWRNFTTISDQKFYDFAVNGIYYLITSGNTVEVSFRDAGLNTYSGNVTVPETVSYGGVTYQVTGIGTGAFANCANLTGVTLPSTVTYISDLAFMSCPSLGSVTLPNSLLTIGKRAFRDCTGLTSVTIPNSVTTIGMMAFDGCTGLTSVVIGCSVTFIGSYAFDDCDALRDVTCLASTPPVMENAGVFNDDTYADGTLTIPEASQSAYHSANWWKNFTTFTTFVPEAYAVYTPSNRTLTFYYDNQRSSRTGTTYDLNTGNNYPDWQSDARIYSVKYVVFDPSFVGARPTTTLRWFNEMQNLQSIEGMSYLNTSEVTNMSSMFSNCTKLTSLDLSGWNTSKVTNLGWMFYECANLSVLDLRGWNTSNVTEMSYMFYKCANLSVLDLRGWNTSNVTEMSYMFYKCNALESLDLSHFNTANVTLMSWMFYNCSGLTSLDLSGWNTSKVTNMYAMFYNNSTLQTIYVGNGWSTAAVTNSTDMFYNCTSLVGGKGTAWNSSNPTNKTYAHIDGGPSNPGYFTEKMPEAYACYTPENTTLTFYYDTQRSSHTGTTYDMNTEANSPGWFTDGTNANVTKVVFNPLFAFASPTSCHNWFYKMTNLHSIEGMEYLNTIEVTNMSCMFCDCSELTSIDVSHFYTYLVTDMYCMFYKCNALESLDLSSFNTANVTTTSYMFSNCSNLQTIYVGSGWNTDDVVSTNDMFANCVNLVGGQGTSYDANHVDGSYAHDDGGPSNPGYLTAVLEAYACYTPSNTTLTFYYDTQRSSRTGTTYDLPKGEYDDIGWRTSYTFVDVTRVVFTPSFVAARPTTTRSWFYGMQNLQSIEGMSYLNTSEVTNMGFMFSGCSILTSLDLSSFNTAKVTDMSAMFSDCTELTTIYAGDEWTTDAVISSSGMFRNSINLVGGQGTTFSYQNPSNKTYAHIDGGPSNPGYFTGNPVGLRGDVNGRDGVTIADVSALIDYLLTGDATGINMAAADCNGLDGVTIADVSALIDYLLTGSW